MKKQLADLNQQYTQLKEDNKVWVFISDSLLILLLEKRRWV
jgi:hypothetical protein